MRNDGNSLYVCYTSTFGGLQWRKLLTMRHRKYNWSLYIMKSAYFIFMPRAGCQRATTKWTRTSKLGWPHQRENVISGGGGITRLWLWRSSDVNLVMQFGTNKLTWMGYMPAKFRDSSSRISWFAHRRFLPPACPPGGNNSAIYPLMRQKSRSCSWALSSQQTENEMQCNAVGLGWPSTRRC